MGDVSDVSLVSNGAAFFGLWSAGDGLVGKVSYDVRTAEAPAFDTSAVAQARELVLARSVNELLIVQLQVEGKLTLNSVSGDVDDNSSGLSYAGGHNPFNDTNTDVVVTLFLGTMSSSYSDQLAELPVSRTYTLEYDSAAPMESTSGTLNAYLASGGLVLAQHVRESLTPFPVASTQIPGKWAFVHLADEHYVLAVATSDGIELQRLALIDGVSAPEISNGPTTTLDVGNVNFLELAAFEGGFALFYDQGVGNDRTWTIVPVRVETSDSDIEVFSCQPGMAFDYPAAVAYKDVDMAALRQGCDLHVGILTSFDVNSAQFTHLEGAQFRGFYAE